MGRIYFLASDAFLCSKGMIFSFWGILSLKTTAVYSDTVVQTIKG